MKYEFKLIPQIYKDSVWLMRVSAELSKLKGVRQISLTMGTKSNLELLVNAGFPISDLEAGPNDIVIAIEAEDDQVHEALEKAQEYLTKDFSTPHDSNYKTEERLCASIEEASELHKDINLSLISVPGEYAPAEIEKSLNAGLHTMCFSDNVSIEDEIRLKQLAESKELMLMGPDCGTAIINGIPLAFANMVAQGDIGLIGASGTGLQELSVLIHNKGYGISQAIGTGGRDLKKEVGGITTLRALEILEHDDNTSIIVLISKPASQEVIDKILKRTAQSKKIIVLNILGTKLEDLPSHMYSADTLENAALEACLHSDKELGEDLMVDIQDTNTITFTKRQKYIRGLFTGGTLCYEATLLLAHNVDNLYSNTPVLHITAPKNLWKSEKNTLIDMGEDEFTRGRPHPMIDPSLRNKRILEEAQDEEVAVILFDLVLGYGSHPDPAADLANTIKEAKIISQRGGQELLFVGHICGTALDVQDTLKQTHVLEAEGVILRYSNADAVRYSMHALKTR